MRAATYSGAAEDYTAFIHHESCHIPRCCWGLYSLYTSWELPHTQVLLGTLQPLYIMRAATYPGAAEDYTAFIHHESCHILRCCWGLYSLYTSWELPHTQVLLRTIQPLYIMRAATYSGAAEDYTAFIHHESRHILRCCWGLIQPLYIMRAATYSGAAWDYTAFIHHESCHILRCCWGLYSLYTSWELATYSGAAEDYTALIHHESCHILRCCWGLYSLYTSWELPHTQVLLRTIQPLYIMRAATYSAAAEDYTAFIHHESCHIPSAAGDYTCFIHHESCHILRCCWGLYSLYTSWELPHTQVLLRTLQPLYIMRAATDSGAAEDYTAFIHHESCHILRCCWGLYSLYTSWELPHTQVLLGTLQPLYIMRAATYPVLLARQVRWRRTKNMKKMSSLWVIFFYHWWWKLSVLIQNSLQILKTIDSKACFLPQLHHSSKSFGWPNQTTVNLCYYY